MNLQNLFRTFYYLRISLLIVLGVIATLMLQNQSELLRSQDIRFKSYVIATELRQSSDDLTRCCRTYVSTGDTTWEKRYWEVLDIRNGKKPRPDGRTIALKDSMKELGFTEAELAKLKEAEQNSNDLVWTEQVAFHARKGLFDDGKGAFTVRRTPDQAMARRIMYDARYQAAKAKIMAPIADFFSMLDTRTGGDLQFHTERSSWMLRAIIGLILLIAVISTTSFLILKEKIIKQLDELKGAYKKIEESEVQFRSFMDGLPGLAYIKDSDIRVLFSNRGFQTYLGIDPATILNKTSAEIFPQEFARRVEQDDRRVLESGAREVIEEKFGERVWSTHKFIIPRLNDRPLLGGITIDITERKRAEENARKLSRAVEHSPASIVITDTTGAIEYVNPKFTQVTGYTFEEARGQNPRILKSNATPTEVYQELWETIKSGKEWRGEFCNRKKNGDLYWEAASISPILNDEGTVTHFVAVKEDITEQKRTGQALHYERSLLRTLIDNIPDLVYSKDAKCRKTLANKADVRIMKIASEAEALGKDDFAFYPPEVASVLYAEDRKVIETGEPVLNKEELYFDEQGHRRWFLTSKYPLRDTRGAVIGLAGIGHDITERKNADEILKQNEIRLREAQALAHVGNWELDLATQTIRSSEEAARIYGIDLGDLSVPLNLIQHAVVPQHRQKIEQAMNDLVAARKLYDEEFQFRRINDGALRWLHTKAELVDDGSGNPMKLVGTIQDITDQKRTEEQLVKTAEDLKRSNTELEQFAYIASHDLQEPLRMVSSYTQLLEKRYKDKLDQDARDFISFAVDGAVRMQNLIKSLLTYSRISRVPMSYDEVNCSTVLDEALSNLRILIDETKATIRFTSLPVIRGQRAFLIQLFQNLISNGLKFHKPEVPPAISISAKEKVGAWEFAFRDNGIGIDPQFFERIFVIFQRLHSHAEYEGTGIGLTVCRKIVERHGGAIWLDSIPNVGTTFYFTIPKDHEASHDRQPDLSPAD